MPSLTPNVYCSTKPITKTGMRDEEEGGDQHQVVQETVAPQAGEHTGGEADDRLDGERHQASLSVIGYASAIRLITG